jgi:hypothetical protein
MSKTPDPGESTQPISQSQVLAVSPPKPPPRGIAPNDQSVAWRGTVVSADEFAPAPAKRGSRAKWAVVALLGAGGLGGGAYAMWGRGGGSPDAPATAAMVAPAPGSAAGSAAGSATPAPAVAASTPAATNPGSAAAPAVADAGVATAPVVAAGSAAPSATTTTNPVAHRHVVHRKHLQKRHHR